MTAITSKSLKLAFAAAAVLSLAACEKNAVPPPSTPAAPTAEAAKEAPTPAPEQKDEQASKEEAKAAEAAKADESPAKGADGEAKAEASGKILIAYYSWGGNTRTVAGYLQKATGADVYEIVPATAYSTEFKAVLEQSKAEIDGGVHPALRDAIPDMAGYDAVLVGAPNWYGTIAPPVATFLDGADLKGKTVHVFITHGSGGLQNTVKDLARMAEAKGAQVKTDALDLFGDQVAGAEADSIKWLKASGIAVR